MRLPAAPRAHRSIATRLRWSYLISSALPLVVVGALLLYLNLDAQQRSIYNEQRSTAVRAGRDISRYLSDLRQELESYTLRVRPTVPTAQLTEAAQNLQARVFPDLLALSVIGGDSQEMLRVTRLQAVDQSTLRSYTDDPAIQGALHFGKIEYAPITVNSDGKLSFRLTLPIRNDAGAIIGALRAEISGDPIVRELATVATETTSSAYVLNQADNTVLTDGGVTGRMAAPQLGRLISSPDSAAEYIGADSQAVVGALAPITVGPRHEQTGWLVVAERPASGAFANIRRSALLLAGLVAIVGMFVLIWALQQARRFLAPIEALRDGAAALGAGRLDHRITQIADDELGDVARAFNQMAGHLQQSLAEIAQQNERLRRGLALARDIQIGLLPDRPPWGTDTVSVYARSIPAYEVGGDFYTYLALSEGRAAIAIGDISGKGIGAALLMALTASAVESQGRQLEHPAQVLSALNQLLAPRLKANHMNAALLFAVFDPREATLRVANAGMIAPVLISHSGNRFIDVGGLPLGAFSGALYNEVEINLEPGDTLLLVSDGVVEAHDEAGELFGFEQLERTVAGAAPGDVRALVELVLVRVQEHMGTADQHDDITIVGIRPHLLSVPEHVEQEQAIDYAVI